MINEKLLDIWFDPENKKYSHIVFFTLSVESFLGSTSTLHMLNHIKELESNVV